VGGVASVTIGKDAEPPNESKNGKEAGQQGNEGVYLHQGQPDGTTFEFVQSDAGVYNLDTSNQGVALVTTVAHARSRYTNADYLKAVTDRNLQIEVGRPSTKNFIRIVTDNLLPNCPITKADILAAEDIFGHASALSKESLQEQSLTRFDQSSYTSLSKFCSVAGRSLFA
jgi:hypothetical protein